MPLHPLPRLRKLCLALPESHEVEAWGAPTFRVRNKLFAMFADSSDHHGGGRNAVWIKATHLTQDLLIRAQPARYFSPPYVGPSGWVGAVLDGSTDWGAVEDLLREAWIMTAPKRVQPLLTAPSPDQPGKSKKSEKSGRPGTAGNGSRGRTTAAGRGARTRKR
jgi:hypothetical protein